jgi:hypothetical protein
MENVGNPDPGKDPELIFIAKRLEDATTLEALFIRAGIDYDVEPDEYQGGVIFRRMRIGAFFYVAEELRAKAVSVMLENGYVPVE